MAPVPNLPAVLQDAIANDSFPADEAVLTFGFPPDATAPFVDAITRSRQDLEKEIREVSRNASDVDGWINRAKKLQKDIAKCKLEARQIVEEHERVEKLRTAAREATAKVSFLEGEITFTQGLESELSIISEVSSELKEVEHTLNAGNAVEGASRLAQLEQRINAISTSQLRSLLYDSFGKCTEATRKQLDTALDSTISRRRDDLSISLTIHSESMPDLLNACSRLGWTSAAVAQIGHHLEGFILHPDVVGKSSKISSTNTVDGKVVVTLDTQLATTENVLRVAGIITNYVHHALPGTIRQDVEELIVPSIAETLVNECLIPAIPLEISEIENLEQVSKQTLALAQDLEDLAGNGSRLLQRWVDQIPQIWLAERRMGSLDAVRHIFKQADFHTRRVERVERGTIKGSDPVKQEADNEDWNAEWDDENMKDQTKQDQTEDDSSGWGFEEEDDDKDVNANGNQNADDEGDAWGWDDDQTEEEKLRAQPARPQVRSPKKTNGTTQSKPKETEMVIKETYSITDIPDHLLEIISKDIHDAQELQSSPSGSLSKPSISSGLLSLCTLTLAMFRAVAVTAYTSTPSLSNMHLYNDSLYIISKLETLQTPSTLPNLQSDTAMLLKLARSSYSREMETQRTILSDFLDGAQGFTSSTKPPFSTEISTSVVSVVDRIRAVHSTWKPLLAESALLQSIGALVTTIIDKITRDILDMDDISEPESHQLSSHCKTITSLRDLFLSVPPAPQQSEQHSEPRDDAEPRDTAALYIPSWIRFEYLIEMLSSSLADIRWMWEEGELSLFWDRKEVVELIVALFAESRYRRDAVQAIRASRTS